MTPLAINYQGLLVAMTSPAREIDVGDTLQTFDGVPIVVKRIDREFIGSFGGQCKHWLALLSNGKTLDASTLRQLYVLA